MSGNTKRPDSEGRARLASSQARLVAALTSATPPPEGFDASRVQATAAALRSKRRRAVARAWPALATSLGREFRRQFDAYAAASPYPAEGGPAADARAFAEHLARRGQLPDAASVELLLSRCRRGLPVRIGLLPRPRRLVVALRLPWRGVRYVTLSLGRSAPVQDAPSDAAHASSGH